MDRSDFKFICAVGFCIVIGMIIAMTMYAALCIHLNIEKGTIDGAVYIPAILGAFGGGWLGASIFGRNP